MQERTACNPSRAKLCSVWGPSWPSFQFINKTGVTQFRLRFTLDDNDDMSADYMTFRSGNYPVVNDRPELEVEFNP